MHKILVIEDQESVRENIASILEFEGFDFHTSANGIQGLQDIKGFQPDLIICDIMMPDMDGYEVLRRLKEEEQFANIPFIFLTARTTINEMRYGMTIGADDYITKPFSASDLIAAIQTRLEKREKIIKVYHEKLIKTEKKLANIAEYDINTGYPNHIFLKKELDELIVRNYDKPGLFIIIFRIDNFDHAAIIISPEERISLQKQVLTNIKENLGNSQLRIYHIETNEFAILIPGVRSDAVEELAERILKFIRIPVSVDLMEFNLTGSVGISIRQTEEDSSNLLQNARLVMESAFESGGNQYQIFNKTIKAKVKNQILIENKIHRAIENNEFEVLYQPKVDIQTGYLIGMEALIRWNNPELGLLSPISFISYVESSRLIFSIGEWVLFRACMQNKLWQNLGFRKIKVAVNVSPIQILESDFPEVVERILEQTGLDARWLELEITESSLIEEQVRTAKSLQKLRSMGVSIAMDDFGTGYSSLAYIKLLPLDIIKIDKKFINDIVDNPYDRLILQTVIKLAYILNLDIVAEGVETAEQLSTLANYGIRYIQGYYFSRPISADDFETLLKENRRLEFPPHP